MKTYALALEFLDEALAETLHNIPSDHEILKLVNELAVRLVNADLQPGEQPLPEDFRCDMSRVGFIRRRWEKAVEIARDKNGYDVIDSLRRIEADLRNPTNAPVLYR